MDWTEYTRFGIGLFALLFPFTKVPLLISLIGDKKNHVQAAALAAGLTVTGALLAAQYFGEVVLTSLGTSLASFQIGGGLVILLSGLTMVRSDARAALAVPADGAAAIGYSIQVGVAPIGMPALAGAGSITKVILETHDHYGIEDEGAISLMILLNAAACAVILASAPFLCRVIGQSGIKIMERLFGLIALAVGVEIMTKGVFTHAVTLMSR